MVKKFLAKKFKDLTLKVMRSYGTKTKVSPNQVKIGSTESGLYYDKSFPFLEKYTQMGGYGKEIVKVYYEPSNGIYLDIWFSTSSL